MKRIENRDITSAVGGIGYDLIDNFLGPALGISGIFADLYLADLGTYFYLEKGSKEATLAAKTLSKFYLKYGIKLDKVGISIRLTMPIALLALDVMENGNYWTKHWKDGRTQKRKGHSKKG